MDRPATLVLCLLLLDSAFMVVAWLRLRLAGAASSGARERVERVVSGALCVAAVFGFPLLNVNGQRQPFLAGGLVVVLLVVTRQGRADLVRRDTHLRQVGAGDT